MRTYQVDNTEYNLPEQMQAQHQHHQPATYGPWWIQDLHQHNPKNKR